MASRECGEPEFKTTCHSDADLIHLRALRISYILALETLHRD